MKQLTTLLAASAALTGSILAGQPTMDKKMVVPAIECYGTGWYGAIQGGVNLYQDSGGGREFTTRRGNKVALDPDQNIGGFGGLKLGYVFGTGAVRPAFEADIYYNGIDADVDVSVNGDSKGTIGARIDSIAFMGNALLKFGCDKFQPYLGFGLGYWTAEANDGSVKINGEDRRDFSTNSAGDVAWQLIAGGDYYFSTKVSAFLEYKFLNYENAIFDNAIRQQLLGVGVRLHF